MTLAPPALAARRLCKSFGPIEVLSDVSLDFAAGDVHAIIGENGAGKSTLMKMLSAATSQPTRGVDQARRRRRPSCAGRSTPSGAASCWSIRRSCSRPT